MRQGGGGRLIDEWVRVKQGEADLRNAIVEIDF